ncbi:hypothetical protein CCUS01_15484 [Colletotrichum cuscutae]|uniref:Uncharacterized protein n=1 Tax=Colletotrichum cuscutae TaxID=1209917 RepID=A0AAI9VG69_9PEZI|nr:hypothetical protein CCUS01_15484 [Colletotrichum cuscutae]
MSSQGTSRLQSITYLLSTISSYLVPLPSSDLVCPGQDQSEHPLLVPTYSGKFSRHLGNEKIVGRPEPSNVPALWQFNNALRLAVYNITETEHVCHFSLPQRGSWRGLKFSTALSVLPELPSYLLFNSRSRHQQYVDNMYQKNMYMASRNTRGVHLPPTHALDSLSPKAKSSDRRPMTARTRTTFSSRCAKDKAERGTTAHCQKLGALNCWKIPVSIFSAQNHNLFHTWIRDFPFDTIHFSVLLSPLCSREIGRSSEALYGSMDFQFHRDVPLRGSAQGRQVPFRTLLWPSPLAGFRQIILGTKEKALSALTDWDVSSPDLQQQELQQPASIRNQPEWWAEKPHQNFPVQSRWCGAHQPARGASNS